MIASDQQIIDKLVTARIALLLKHPFFGNLATRLKLVNADNWCPTAGTDGRHFFYNTKFIDSLTPKEAEFLFGHEVLHNVFEHMLVRIGDIQPMLWNIAADYAVNQILMEQKSNIKMDVFLYKDLNEFFNNTKYNNIKSIIDHHDLFVNHKKHWYYAGININDYYIYKPSDIDITRMTWIADSVSIYSLIVAIYMGFSEIYLLGMDHNYICNKESDYRFYKNGIHQKNEDKRVIKDSSRTKHASLGIYNIFSQYELLSDNSDTIILNTSKDTLLDVFKYVTFNDVI